MKNAIDSGQVDAKNRVEIVQFKRDFKFFTNLEEIESPPASDDEEGKRQQREKKMAALRQGSQRKSELYRRLREISERDLGEKDEMTECHEFSVTEDNSISDSLNLPSALTSDGLERNWAYTPSYADFPWKGMPTKTLDEVCVYPRVYFIFLRH